MILDKYKELYRNKIRQISNMFLIENIKTIELAEHYGVKIVDKFSIYDKIGFNKISTHIMNKLTDTKFIEYLAIGKYIKPTFSNGPYVLCDNIMDYGNLGSIIRTCHAFNIENIIIFNTEKDFLHHKVFESSRYLVFKKMPLYINNLNECLDFLKHKNLIVTTMNGKFFNKKLDSNDVVVFGNETNGITREIINISNENFTIPIQNIESLNVSNAVAITLFYFQLM